MSAAFANRSAAGRVLGRELATSIDRSEAVVLGLPRGGVPVAYEVARMLQLPLGICLVRKLGAPGQEELAMGAIASGGSCILNRDVLDWLQIPDAVLEATLSRERQELQRRERLYGGDRLQITPRGRTAILVDDGIATGATLQAAIAAMDRQGAARIIAAAPVGARAVCARLQAQVDGMVCLVTPEPLSAVGYWYADFSQVSDAEVRCLLAAAGPAASFPSKPQSLRL